MPMLINTPAKEEAGTRAEQKRKQRETALSEIVSWKSSKYFLGAIELPEK